jgi:hypothetical protein
MESASNFHFRLVTNMAAQRASNRHAVGRTLQALAGCHTAIGALMAG